MVFLNMHNSWVLQSSVSEQLILQQTSDTNIAHEYILPHTLQCTFTSDTWKKYKSLLDFPLKYIIYTQETLTEG